MRYLIGVQPTGKLHIGNYLGCLKKGLKLQDEGHEVIFLIANYHSLTTDSYTDETELELQKLGCKTIVRQTPVYTELFFQLCCKMNLSILLKMPQYKDKKETAKNDLGLLLYPVLMAADIIMNEPDVVIIGKDQVAHLELCNDIAKKHNGKYYNYELGDVEKVMSLQDPSKKMSKSLGEKHVLYLFGEDYLAKIKKANSTEEGITNLKLIASSLGINKEFSMNIELKTAIAEKMQEIFDILK